MSRVRGMLFRLAGLFRRRAHEESMIEEIRAHLDGLVDRYVAAGLSPDEARSAAQRQFGNVVGVRERAREQRTWVWLEQLAKDFRFAVRSLTRSPGFTLAVVITLAVGIGATTAIISIARRVLFPAIPFSEPDRTVIVTDPDPTGRQLHPRYASFAFPYRMAYLHEAASSFALLGAQSVQQMNLVVAGDPFVVPVGWVTADYFAALDVAATHGRLFLPEEYRGRDGDVAVLSWQMWQEHFEGSPRILGQDIFLGGRSRRVVGVLPRGFVQPLQTGWVVGVWLPAAISPTPGYSRDRLEVVGRLRPGVSFEQARSEMKVIQYPTSGSFLNATRLERLRPELVPLPAYYNTETGALFWAFIGAVGLLYAIACSNAVNLMLARLVGRRRELGIRLALGCGRRRVVRLLVAEAAVLAFGGGAIGLLIASLSSWAMTPLLPYDAIFFSSRLRLDHPLFAIASVLSALTCVIVSIVPAWRIGQTRLNEALAEGAGTLGDSRRLRRLRGGLVGTQAALAVVLLVGMGLTLRSYLRLLNLDYGFDPADKLVINGILPEGVSPDSYLRIAEQVRVNLAGLPGVRDATLAYAVPLSRSLALNSVKIEGRPELGAVRFSYNKVSPEYFATFGLPILAGRGFDGIRSGDPPVAVISRTAARRCFGDGDPIGHRLESDDGVKYQIIGVVGDVRDFGPRMDPDPQYYVPFWQPPINGASVSVLLRMKTSARMGFDAAVRRAVYSAHPGVVVYLSSLSENALGGIRTERYSMVVLEVMASLALVLAALGMFAVTAYSVAQRQREFGLRMALGAGPNDLVRLVLGHGLRVVVPGVAVGLFAALGLTRFIRSVLYETNPTDPLTFAGVAAVLVAAALAACWLPARRAARVDAARLLRAE